MTITQLTLICQESATTAISMHLDVPVTMRQAQLLTDLWNHYYAAALAYYDAK
jgi:hypothetical protein